MTVKTVHIEGNGFLMVVFAQAGANPDGCGSATQAIVETSDSYYQATLALLISAYATQTPIAVWTNGCVTTPWGYTIPHIWSADLNP